MLKVEYGYNKNNCIDVTDKCIAKGGIISIKNYNIMFGDPYPNIPKKLYINLNNKKYEYEEDFPVIYKIDIKTNKIQENTFCIVATFKNESEILDEWIKHYINEGCSKFFLIDNGSDDNYLPIIEKYKDWIVLVMDERLHRQVENYNYYFSERVKSYTWTLTCDLDEFVYARNGYKTISDYLSSVNSNISSLSIPWKMFGSNGYNTLDKKEPDSAIKSFTKRINNDIDRKHNGVYGENQKGKVKHIFVKTITRNSHIKEIGLHGPPHGKPMMLTNSNHSTFKASGTVEVNEALLESQCLHLNHYAIRSYDWFSRIKMTRGDVLLLSSQYVRNDHYYKIYDFNDMEDTELKDKIYT